MPAALPHWVAVDVREHFSPKVGVCMSNEWDQSDLDDLENEDEGSKKPNPLRKRMRELEKENKDLKEANEKLSKQTRKASVQDLLKDAKVKHASKVAGLVPADVEATAEGLKKWLDDFADVFSIETEETDEGDDSNEPDPEEAEQAEKMGRINKVTAATSTPGKQADIARRLADPKLTREELLQMIEDAGGGFGSG